MSHQHPLSSFPPQSPSTPKPCITRPNINDVSSIEDVIRLLKCSKRILVITGAGISVSCGIPDFRSKDIGIYQNFDTKRFANIPSPELLFDLEYFKIDPKPFYSLLPRLFPNPTIKPSFTHRFLTLLNSKKKLLRNYTQNIDGLELRAGLSKKKIIACHGSMEEFHCLKCCRRLKTSQLKSEEILSLEAGDFLYCKSKPCKEEVLKPSITFFGESLPANVIPSIHDDIAKCDLLLIIGTV